jgi:hypothetical protein
VAFSPDGKRVAVATGDAIVFFEVPPPPVPTPRPSPITIETEPFGSVPIQWRQGMFDHDSDEAAAIAWGSNDTVWYLALWKGVVLKVRAP